MTAKSYPLLKNGVYSAIDLFANAEDTNDVKNYKNLLNKEYAFCLKTMDSILRKASKLYDKQKETGKVIKFCANFALLRSAAPYVRDTEGAKRSEASSANVGMKRQRNL